MKTLHQTLHKPCVKPAPRQKRSISVDDLLIWAYRDVRIDEAVKRNAIMAGPRGYGSSVIWQLGTHVDGSAATRAIGVDEDALRVHGAVCALAVLDAEAAGVVVTFARAGTEPEWHGREAETIVPVMTARGYAVELGPGRRAVACLVRPRVDPALVKFTRWQWAKLSLIHI